MAERDEVLDRAPGAGDVVDVDADHLHVGQGALEHDREPVADERDQVGIVDPWAGDDETVRVLGAKERGVCGVRAVGRERLDHHPEPLRPGGGGQAAQRLRQDGIAGDLLR